MADINVLMTGGRRAGKTTVMAAVDDCSNNSLADVPNLSVSCEAGFTALQLKRAELEQYFDKEYMKKQGMTFSPDRNPNFGAETYTYEVNVNNRDSGFTLSFTDIPGEHIGRKEHEEDTQKRFNESQIIIIAIDTPHMVEETDEVTKVGKYHNEYNLVPEITRFFQTAFQKSKEPRMVLFVPLKCEKYYYKDKMGMVVEKIKEGYSDLLSFLGNAELKELCTVAIIPIITIGGVEFFKGVNLFKDQPKNNATYVGIYNYVMDSNLRDYKPKYCEQPLFYTLNYLIRMSEKRKTKQNIVSRWFRESFFKEAKLADLINCKEDLEKLIEKNPEKGFEIIQDPLGIGEK